MESTASPETFFGSKEYFQGARLKAQGYTYVDALTIEHEATGIKMWACAIDVREDAGHQGLREGDRVLFHYTPEDAFKKITSLENPKLLAPLGETNKDNYFGLGIYATMKAPHKWNSKTEVLVNNYYPTKDNFREKKGLDLPGPDVPFNAALNGAIGDYVKCQYNGKADCCIPLIVDEQVSKNVMEEVTDGPLMPNGKKRLKGRDCFGEMQPFWRDVWLVSIYNQARAENLGVKDAQQSSSEIVQILEKRLETDEFVQNLAKYGIRNYREIRKKLLVKVIEAKPGDSHAYINLGCLLSPGETVQAKLKAGLSTFNEKELYLEAIKLDKNNGTAFNNLGFVLSPNETVRVQLPTGLRTFTETELYLRAIKLNNSYAMAYNNLGNRLSPGETVNVHLRTGFRTFNAKELYLEAIKLDNNIADAYNNLGKSLSREEMVQVCLQAAFRTFNAKWLYLEAIKLDNNLADAFYNLGTSLSQEETVQVHQKTGFRTFNKKELYLETIKLDNDYAKAYNNLGAELSPGETVQVQLQSGPRMFSQKELYLETIKLDNNYAYAFYNLGNRLSPGETVKVHLQTGFRTFNAKELYLEAINLDNNIDLGKSLSREETVQVRLQTTLRTPTKPLLNWIFEQRLAAYFATGHLVAVGSATVVLPAAVAAPGRRAVHLGTLQRLAKPGATTWPVETWRVGGWLVRVDG
eukprot:Skav221325  [mRNA]  locus=scaffold2901:300387:303233:+ [translate_table: standard]